MNPTLSMSMSGHRWRELVETFTGTNGTALPTYNTKFTGSTWTIQSGRAVNNPTQGAEQNSGTLTVGHVYAITATQVNYFFTGCAIGDHFFATATTALDANNKVKEITFSECFATFNGGAVGAGYRFKATFTDETGGIKGGYVGLNSATSPTQGLRFTLSEGTGKMTLAAMTAAYTYTSLISTAVTYSADAELVLVYDSVLAKVWLFYNNAIVGTAQDVSTYTWLKSNTIHGLFSTGQAANEGFTSMDYGPLRYGADLFDAGAGTFASGTYGWTVYGTNTAENDAGQLKITYVDNSSGAYLGLRNATDFSADMTVGAIYRLDYAVRVNAGSVIFGHWQAGVAVLETIATVTATTLTSSSHYLVATHITGDTIRFADMGAGEIIWLDNLVLRQVN